MDGSKIPEAWVRIATDEQVREQIPEGAKFPYDFGFMAAMSRLIRVHPRIGPAFGALFAQIMFAPGHLDRREREMIATVTAAAQDCRY